MSLYIFSILSLFITIQSYETVITPFGKVRKSCVHYAPKGSVIHEKENHTELHHHDGRIQKFESCEELIDPRKGKNGFYSNFKKSNSDSFDLEGWIDYTGWYPSNSGYKVPITSFVGYNSVPDTPVDTTGQTLYWFIGMQNNENVMVRILQPVLTFSGAGAGGDGAPEGWSFMSWNCCPRGQVWYSDPVTDFVPGDILYGSIITEDNGETYTIVSSSATNSTSLTISTSGLTFDWADVTLEVYSVTSCAMFPTVPVAFSGMIVNTTSDVTAIPNWTVYSGSTCNDAVKVISGDSVTINASP